MKLRQRNVCRNPRALTRERSVNFRLLDQGNFWDMGELFGSSFNVAQATLSNNFTITTTGSFVIAAGQPFVQAGNGAAIGSIQLTPVGTLRCNPHKPWRFFGMAQFNGGAALSNAAQVFDNNSPWGFNLVRTAAGIVRAQLIDSSNTITFTVSLTYNNREWINYELAFDGVNTSFYCDHFVAPTPPTLGVRQFINSTVAQPPIAIGGIINMSYFTQSGGVATNIVSAGPFSFYGSVA